MLCQFSATPKTMNNYQLGQFNMLSKASIFWKGSGMENDSNCVNQTCSQNGPATKH